MQDASDLSLLVRRGAGLFKNFPRGMLAVRGKDRAVFLHNVLSHDIKGLPAGQARQACLLDRQGKIRFWALAHARPEEILLETAPESVPVARAELGRYLVSEDAQIEDASARFRLLALHGPAGPEILRRAYPALDPPGSSYLDSAGPAGSGIEIIARWDLLGVPGFHLWAHPDAAEAVAQLLLLEGQSLGAAPAEMETFEIPRIEAGVPWPGREMNPDVILNELVRDDLVSFTKGCYIGQEIVARIKHRAHPPRLLTGFLLEGDRVPPCPSPVHQADQPVGLVTSSCFSPALRKVIALGFLKFGAPESGLQVQTPAGPIPARPTPLPFV
ncbi:MAG: aminomethyl transferase family protein [Candidatus Omnitrophica bacterium]|nr:aminomethyl transferase family protein [Candidatus Omnitrophota bacterium]